MEAVDVDLVGASPVALGHRRQYRAHVEEGVYLVLPHRPVDLPEVGHVDVGARPRRLDVVMQTSLETGGYDVVASVPGSQRGNEVGADLSRGPCHEDSLHRVTPHSGFVARLRLAEIPVDMVNHFDFNLHVGLTLPRSSFTLCTGAGTGGPLDGC